MKKSMISKIAFAIIIATAGNNLNCITLDSKDITNAVLLGVKKATNTSMSDIAKVIVNGKTCSAVAAVGAFVALTQINAQYNIVYAIKQLKAQTKFTDEEIIKAVKANKALIAKNNIKDIVDSAVEISEKIAELKKLDDADLNKILNQKKYTYLNPNNWEWKQALNPKGWNVFTSIKNASKSALNVVTTIFGGESYAQQITQLKKDNQELKKESETAKKGVTPVLKLDQQTPDKLILMANALGLDKNEDVVELGVLLKNNTSCVTKSINLLTSQVKTLITSTVGADFSKAIIAVTAVDDKKA